MSGLGEILELFFGPAAPFRSLRATIRQWQNTDISKTAQAGAEKQWGRRKATIKPSAKAALDESQLTVWLSGPDRVRVDVRSMDNPANEPAFTAINGDAWTIRDKDGRLESGTGRCVSPHTTDIERHFDPKLIREIMAGLVLLGRGTVRTAGRDCVRVHAVLRTCGRMWPHWLPKQADEYEFHADCERAILLALTARYQGAAFWTSEVTDIHFDEALADSLFQYAPKPNEQVQPAIPVTERLTLAAASASMPFTVLVGPPPPGFSEVLEFMYSPARPRSPRTKLSLHFSCEGKPRRFLSITESAAENPNHEQCEWESLEHEGLLLKISDPGPGRGYRLVALQKHGTFVDICSDLELEKLLELAASLTPASR